MAKKQLNKKVAIVGLVVLACLAVAAALVLRSLIKDPEKLLNEARTESEAVQMLLTEYRTAVSNRTNAEEMLEHGQESYLKIINKYREAYGACKDDARKIEILFMMADYYLTNNEFHEAEPEQALRTWYSVTNIDPRHLDARMLLLNYFYEAADSGVQRLWSRVREQIVGSVNGDSESLLQVMADKQMPPDPFVIKAKARANYGMAATGEAIDQTQSIEEAIKDFQTLLELMPDDVEAYKFLADAMLLRGEMRKSAGDTTAVDTALTEAEQVLQRCVDSHDDNPNAHVNLLRLKLAGARRDEEDTGNTGVQLEELVEKFPASGEAWLALAEYYQSIHQLDKAIEAIEHARQNDKQNLSYVMSALALYYRKASLDNDSDAFEKALSTATEALTYPDAQNTPGPRQNRRVNNRLGLLTFLSRMHAERALDASDAADIEQRDKWAKRTEETVRSIEELYPSPDNIYCVMWRGILSLARGEKQAAIRQMHDAYEQMTAADTVNPILCYMLARATKDEPEIGIHSEYLRNAIVFGAATDRPQLLLDYADIVLQMRDLQSAVNLANDYEQTLGPTKRTRAIKASAYISSGQYDKATEIIEQMQPDSAETKSLWFSVRSGQITNLAYTETQKPLSDEEKTQLENYRNKRAEILGELIASDPERVSAGNVIAVCQDYLAQGKNDEAEKIIDSFLSKVPDDASAKVYKLRLIEPDPMNVSAERLHELTVNVLSENQDKFERSLSLGRYFLSSRQTEEAITELQKARDISPENEDVIKLLFEAVLASGSDLKPAEEIVEKAAGMNLDGCQGNFYRARLHLARSEYAQALTKIDQCLEAMPIYAYGYLTRSRINAALGDHEQSIADAETAARMNPLDIIILRQKVSVLHDRVNRLGKDATAEDYRRTEDAIRSALALNPNTLDLQSLYARYRSREHREEAIALRQYLQKRFPDSVENHLLLAELATRAARIENDSAKKETYVSLAGSAIESAYALAPANEAVLDAYSEHLRATGRADEAVKLFSERKDALWKFYLRDGQYDKAAEMLAELYDQDPKNADVVRGLTMVAQMRANKEDLLKYSEELLKIDATPDETRTDELMQIQMFVETGLIKEASLKLASFRERHPDEPRGTLLEAWVKMFQGQLAESLYLVNQYLEINSENAGAWQLRGQIHRLQGNYTQAIEDLQESKRLSPGPSISMDLARVYRQTNSLSIAIGELKAALQDVMAPKQVGLMLEQFYLDAGRKTDLQAFYKERIAKYPDSEAWRYKAARFYIGENKPRQAEALLKQAWMITEQRDVPSASVFDLYLEILGVTGQYDELLSLASKHVDTPLAAIAYTQMAGTQMKLQNKMQALNYYDKALAKCGKDQGMIASTLANMHKSVGVEETAEWAAQKIASDTDSLTSNLVMFTVADKAGDYNKALRHIEKCMATVTTADPAYYQYAIIKANTLASALTKTSDVQYRTRAIEEYTQILDVYPNYLNVLNNLAYLLADTGKDAKQAEEYGARAYAVAPNNPNVIDTYAYTLIHVNRYEEANELLQSALQLYELAATTPPWEVFMHLGQTQEGLGKKEEAVVSYKQAMETGGDSIGDKDKEKLNDCIKRVSRQSIDLTS